WMHRPSACRGRTRFRSSCSRSMIGARWPRCSRARAGPRSSRTAPDIWTRLNAGQGTMAETYNKAELDRRMVGAMEALKKEFSGLRTGRASPALLDPVRVEAYGNQVPVNQVGNISTPEPRLLTVQVWDKGLAK